MKKLYVFVLSVIAVLAANAEPVSRSEALQKARQFMPGKQFNANQASSRSKRVMADKEPFYIFNAEEGGFVVISGDDRTVPVIGYSEKGQLLQDDMPDNLRNWLDGYAEQLQAIENGEATPALPRSAKVTRGVSAKPAIAPLIKTQWNQSVPYNLKVPSLDYEYEGKKYTLPCVTGCVATALAQVMYYYRWPLTCPALDAYTTSSKGIEVPALPATTFQWDKMQLTYAGNETGDPANSVAELMRYVGQANEMDYNISSNGGSGAYIHQDVMFNTFGYSRNMYSAYRYEYSTVEWENLIYQELAAGRPVLYSGTSYDAGADKFGGHQFICDGYDGNGLFHMNWGWGGQSDSYFVLSIANPHSKGIGGGSTKSGYYLGQSAEIGFKPDDKNEPDIPYLESYINIGEACYSRSATSANFENVTTQNCYFTARYLNCVPSTTYPIEVGWALWQDDEIISVLATNDITIDNRDKNKGARKNYYGPTSVSFGAGLLDGNYRLVQVWRPQGSMGDWTIISSNDAIYMEISGNKLDVRRPNYSISYTIDNVSYSGDMSVETDITATITLTNNCDASQQDLFFWVDDVLVGRALSCVESGKTGEVTVIFNYDKVGTFDVKITEDINGNNVMWNNGTITIHDAQEVAIDGITYALYFGSRTAKVMGRTGTSTSLTIPATVSSQGTTFAVKSIAAEAFRETDVAAVSLPSTLKSIGPLAFYNTDLVEIDIPEGVEEIGHHAFAFCWQMKKVSLPSTLRTIENPAFYDIPGLQTVIAAMPAPLEIAPEVFYCWDRTLQQHFNSNATLYVPAGTKAAYQAAEGWDQFPAIYEGKPAETIIDNITYLCVASEGFADIIAADADALEGKDVTIPGSITVGGKTYKVRKIESNTFYQCSMNSLIIEPGIEEIGGKAFWNCFIGGNLVIPEGVETIGAKAFEYCRRYKNTSDLNSLSLPSTLKSIGERAFAQFPLRSLTSNMQHPCAINANVFDQVNLAAATLYIPEGTKSEYLAAAVWQDFGTMMQGEVKEIEIAGITYRYITGEGIANIIAADETALNGKDLVIPGNITVDDKSYKVRKIGNNVFLQFQLASLTIESGVVEIGEYAFWNCRIGGNLVIPEGVKTIGSGAFQYLTRYKYGDLSQLSLPYSLQSIGANAFGGYTSQNLTTVNCRAIRNPFAINSNVFQDDNGTFTTAKLIIPKDKDGNVEASYRATGGWQQFFGGTNEIEELPGRCDANSDGSVSVTDIAVVVNSILSIENGGDFDGFGADANGDGGITVTDIGVIVDMILGTGGTNNARRMTRDAVEPQ